MTHNEFFYLIPRTRNLYHLLRVPEQAGHARLLMHHRVLLPVRPAFVPTKRQQETTRFLYDRALLQAPSASSYLQSI